jgi:hypothetical protein
MKALLVACALLLGGCGLVPIVGSTDWRRQQYIDQQQANQASWGIAQGRASEEHERAKADAEAGAKADAEADAKADAAADTGADTQAEADVDAGVGAKANVGGCVTLSGGGVLLGPDCSNAQAQTKLAANEAEADAEAAEIDKANREWAASHPKEAKAEKRAAFKAQRDSLSSELCVALQAERGHLARISELKRDARIAGVISLRDLHDHQTWAGAWRKVVQAYRNDLQEIGAKPAGCPRSDALEWEELGALDQDGAGDHGPREFITPEGY